MQFGDLVIRLPTLFLVGQKTAPLHEPQVFGGHVAGDSARLGKFPYHVPALEEHLHHPKPMRMRQNLETFRRLRQGVQGREPGPTHGFRFGGHHRSPSIQYIGMFRRINHYFFAAPAQSRQKASRRLRFRHQNAIAGRFSG
jgi:hypothetical protein